MGGCFSIEDRRLNRSANEHHATTNNAPATTAAASLTTIDNGINNSSSLENGVTRADSAEASAAAVQQQPGGDTLTHGGSPRPNSGQNGRSNPSKSAAKSNSSLRNSSSACAEDAATSSDNDGVGSSSNKKNALKCEQIRWRSSDPLSESQLRKKRETFWDTAPTYEGRPEIWAALRAAAEACELQQDYALAQAVLGGAGIELGPAGCLSESWDERGNYYHIPLYCLAAPTNLVADDRVENSSSLSPSVSSTNISISAEHAKPTAAVDPPQNVDEKTDSSVHQPDKTYDAANMLNVRIRFHYVLAPPESLAETARSVSRVSNRSKKTEISVSPTPLKPEETHAVASPLPPVVPAKDVKFPVSQLELVGAAKKRARDKFLQSALPGSSDWRVQHWFFAGRLLNDKQPISSVYMLKANFVIQVIVRERDLKLFQQNHHHHLHHPHPHHTKQNKQHRGSNAAAGEGGSNKSAANGNEKQHTSFFGRLSGSSRSSAAAAATVAAGSSTSTSVVSRPSTPVAAATASSTREEAVTITDDVRPHTRNTFGDVFSTKPKSAVKAQQHDVPSIHLGQSGEVDDNSEPVATQGPTLTTNEGGGDNYAREK